MIVQGLVAAFIAWLLAAWLIRVGVVHARGYDFHKPQRFHWGHVPRLGGVAMLAGWALSSVRLAAAPYLGDVGFMGMSWSVWLAWMLVVLPAWVGGAFEDLTQRLSVGRRLLLTGSSGVLAVLLLDASVVRLDWAWFDPLWGHWPVLGMMVAALAVAGLPHAFNIIDGYNGLASVVAMITALALAYVALKVGDWPLVGVLVSLAAATAGFLFWNYPRGLLFAGDSGAYLWGVVIAVAAVLLVQRHAEVSPWFPMLLLIYPVWETVFSIYRKVARGESPGLADALHFHQLIYRRLVRGVFHKDQARQMLKRNNRTSPYLWAFTILTVIPAVLFWNRTGILMFFCAVSVVTYIWGYLTIVRFKVPRWMQR